MPLHWVRGALEWAGQTTDQTMVSDTVIYQNSRTQTGNLTLVQKVTVVAGFLMAITDTADLFQVRLVVTDEAFTRSFSQPEEATTGGSDPEIKGVYPFAMGPVYFAPRRKISIPSESEFAILLDKVNGGNSSNGHLKYQFLLNTSLNS